MSYPTINQVAYHSKYLWIADFEPCWKLSTVLLFRISSRNRIVIASNTLTARHTANCHSVRWTAPLWQWQLFSVTDSFRVNKQCYLLKFEWFVCISIWFGFVFCLARVLKQRKWVRDQIVRQWGPAILATDIKTLNINTDSVKMKALFYLIWIHHAWRLCQWHRQHIDRKYIHRIQTVWTSFLLASSTPWEHFRSMKSRK